MNQLYFPMGQKFKFEFRTEDEYNSYCKEMKRQHGVAVFEMIWPNKKVFCVFRDKLDNEIEVIFKPITIGGEFA